MKFLIMLISLVFSLNGCSTSNEDENPLTDSPAPVEDSELRFSDGFEGSFAPDPSNLVYNKWYRSGWFADGYVKASSVVEPRSGSRSAEVKLVANENGLSRSEIGINLKNSLGDYWCGFSVYIPSEYDISKMVLDKEKFVSVMAQWGVWENNPGLPDFALRLGSENGNDKFFLTYEPSDKLEYLWDAPLIQGQWVDWVIHINWAKNSTGSFEVWQNGNLVFSKYNFQSTDGEGSEVKSKIGLYYSSWGKNPRGYDEIKVYYDEYKIAKGKNMYDIVAPK